MYLEVADSSDPAVRQVMRVVDGLNRMDANCEGRSVNRAASKIQEAAEAHRENHDLLQRLYAAVTDFTTRIEPLVETTRDQRLKMQKDTEEITRLTDLLDNERGLWGVTIKERDEALSNAEKFQGLFEAEKEIYSTLKASHDQLKREHTSIMAQYIDLKVEHKKLSDESARYGAILERQRKKASLSIALCEILERAGMFRSKNIKLSLAEAELKNIRESFEEKCDPNDSLQVMANDKMIEIDDYEDAGGQEKATGNTGHSSQIHLHSRQRALPNDKSSRHSTSAHDWDGLPPPSFGARDAGGRGGNVKKVTLVKSSTKRKAPMDGSSAETRPAPQRRVELKTHPIIPPRHVADALNLKGGRPTGLVQLGPIRSRRAPQK
ncbi:hypothetical protein FISHEDRAFT_57827 [Fistulina hepatica ATCC 64428]|uniref:Uncharacterized protein n=1 Tax=Fistulina hepatica ATCC 64428 TaxID=1128425 RepID=A0A0D7AFP2_9AGAR|nr:hypothetical protein FISHEDRAFT_57827 [Fistulina hepatica ATCC 64428]